MNGGEVLAIQCPTTTRQAVDWLDTTAATGDDADTTGRRNSGTRCVAHRTVMLDVPYATGPVREVPSFKGKFLAGMMSLLLNESADLRGEINGLFAVISDSQADQGVSKSHEPQADLSIMGTPVK